MDVNWDFIQYCDEINHPVSQSKKYVFECNQCHLLVDHGYGNNVDHKILCAVCSKKHTHVIK